MTCSFTQVQGTAADDQAIPPIVIYGNQPTGEVDGPISEFAELIDIEVLNYQNEKLGRIKAITTDLEHSRLVEVLVSNKSGFLGMRERITPVPPTLFRYDARHEVARLNVSKARFDAAATLPALNAAVYSQADRAAAASRYFGVSPWYAASGLGYVQTSAAIELMQIKNSSGQYMGSVGMLFMDLPSGRIRNVVNNTESMDGSGSHVLSPGSLRYNVRHNGLVLNANFEQVANSPRFRWVHGNGNDTHFVEQINAGPITPEKPALNTFVAAPRNVTTSRNTAMVNKPSKSVRVAAQKSSAQKQKTLASRSATASHVAVR